MKTKITEDIREKYDHGNPLHRALFRCLITGGAGDLAFVDTYAPGNHGSIVTRKTCGTGVYKWRQRGVTVYCCKRQSKIEEV